MRARGAQSAPALSTRHESREFGVSKSFQVPGFPGGRTLRRYKTAKKRGALRSNGRHPACPGSIYTINTSEPVENRQRQNRSKIFQFPAGPGTGFAPAAALSACEPNYRFSRSSKNNRYNFGTNDRIHQSSDSTGPPPGGTRWRDQSPTDPT